MANRYVTGKPRLIKHINGSDFLLDVASEISVHASGLISHLAGSLGNQLVVE